MNVFKNEILRIKEPISLELSCKIITALNEVLPEKTVMIKDDNWQVICLDASLEKSV